VDAGAQSDRVEVEFVDPRRIPLQRVVHVGLATKGLVDEERDRVGEDQDYRDRNADRHPVSPVHAVLPLLAGDGRACRNL
jgi:hypothetical protein